MKPRSGNTALRSFGVRRFSAAFFGLLFLVFLSQKEESEKRRKSAALQNSFRFELLHHHLRHSSALVIALPPLRRQVIRAAELKSAFLREIVDGLSRKTKQALHPHGTGVFIDEVHE